MHAHIQTHTTLTECGSLEGGLFGFFNLATAAACELIAFMKPELSVNPVVAEGKDNIITIAMYSTLGCVYA